MTIQEFNAYGVWGFWTLLILFCGVQLVKYQLLCDRVKDLHDAWRKYEREVGR